MQKLFAIKWCPIAISRRETARSEVAAYCLQPFALTPIDLWVRDSVSKTFKEMWPCDLRKL